MNVVLRGDRNEREPTPRAGPCLDDLGLVDEESLGEAIIILNNKEFNFIDLLVYSKENDEVWIRVELNEECFTTLFLAIKKCNINLKEAFSLIEMPEVDKIEIIRGDRDCITLYSFTYPPLKSKRLLEKIGITPPFKIIGYKPVEEEHIE